MEERDTRYAPPFTLFQHQKEKDMAIKIKSRSKQQAGAALVSGRNPSRTEARRAVARPTSLFLLFVALLILFSVSSNAPSSLTKYDLIGDEDGNNDPTEIASAGAADPFDTSTYGRPILPILKKALARVSGDGWDLNPKSVMESETAKQENLECMWIDFVSSSGKTAKFCGHPDGDLVTRQIGKQKRWPDCDILPKFWNDNGLTKDENSVYVEIGGNIGACVMEMLLSTNAKVIAFEPHPRNQFMLQHTIQALSPEYQERFLLVPVALGKEYARSEIYASHRNMGNSVVGKIIKDFGKQNTNDFVKYDIVVESISSILNAGTDSLVNIPLIKMDAQGFECQILEGLHQNLANRIKKVKFEVTRRHLQPQGCMDLFDRFRNLGFEIESEAGVKVPTGNNYGGGIAEYVAIRK